MSAAIAAQGMILALAAVLYSGWKSNGVPEQSAAGVVMKPFAAEACMNPVRCVVMSLITTSNAWPPPGVGASDMCVLIVSPGFISSVWPLGTNVARVASCGDGGPAGTPFVWMKAKLDGSSQAGLAFEVGVPVKLSMVSAAHQCVASQLSLSTNGALPGG